MRAHRLVPLCLLVVLALLAVPEDRTFAIRAGATRAAEDAAAGLGAPSFAERERAQRLLTSLGESARPAAGEARTSAEPEVRRRAAAVLRALDGSDAPAEDRLVPQYAALLRAGLARPAALADGTPWGDALRAAPGAAARAAVVVAQESEGDFARHRRAVAFVASLGRPESAPYLASLLSRGWPLPSTLWIAADALVALGAPGAREAILAAARGHDAESRAAAVRVLGATGRWEDAPLLAAAAADPEAAVRREASTALGRRQGAEAEMTLEVLAADADPSVRAAALAALARQPTGAGAARRALADPAPEVRVAAARLLAAAGEPADLPAVEALLADPVPEVRAESVRAVAGLGVPLAAFARGVADPAPGVRRAALEALARLDPEARRTALAAAPAETEPWLADLRASLAGR